MIGLPSHVSSWHRRLNLPLRAVGFAVAALAVAGFATAAELPGEAGGAASLVLGRRLARDGSEETDDATVVTPASNDFELGFELVQFQSRTDTWPSLYDRRFAVAKTRNWQSRRDCPTRQFRFEDPLDLKHNLAVALDESQPESNDVELAAHETAPLPLPIDEEPDNVEPDFAARLEELEAKYEDLLESQDSLKGSLKSYVRPGHSNATMKVNGRIHLDMWQFPETTPGINGFETGNLNIPPQDRVGFRRLRFGVKGDVWYNMLYKIEMEFAGGEETEFRDAYLGFTDLPCFQKVLIGNQKRPYGLDHWNSSRYNVFMERPFVIEGFNQDSRRLGIQSWNYSEDLAWNWQYGVFNQRLLQDEGIYTSDHWQAQFAGRLANTIWYDESSDGRGYAHWAISGTTADTDGNANMENYAGSGINEAQFQTRPEARSVNRWLDTGLIDGANYYSLIGLENVINVGPWQFAGEYQRVLLNREPASQLQFHGGYVYLAYFLTGEHMPWNRETGQLARPVPFENFFVVDTCDDGVRRGWGAWQVAVRWSYGDFADEDIQGGVGESVTFGLNWYWTPWSRLQFNYIYGDIHNNALNAVGGIDFGHYQILGTRVMIDF